MKAKEYAKEFLEIKFETEQQINDTVYAIMVRFMEEVKPICESRHSSSDGTVIAVIREQSQKWAAFCRIVNKKLGMEFLKEDGFKNYILLKMPELKGKL
jgi:hypothetical protein